MNLKQRLLAISAGLVLIVPARAKLSPNNFAHLKAWVEEQGYRYDGVETTNDDLGKPTYYWRFSLPNTKAFAIVSHNASTIREAKAAFQSSVLTFVLVTEETNKRLEERDAPTSKSTN